MIYENQINRLINYIGLLKINSNIERIFTMIKKLLMFPLTVILLSSTLCNAAMSIPKGEGLAPDQRQKLKDFIVQARQDAHEIFNNPAQRDVERQRLLNKLNKISSQAANNIADKELIANVRMWIDKAYEATGTALKELNQEVRLKLKDFIALARQEPREIFPDAAQRAARKQQLTQKINELLLLTKNKADQELIQNARMWINKAYAETKNIASQGLSADNKAKLTALTTLAAETIFPPEVLLSAKEQLKGLETRVNKLRTKINEFERQAQSAAEKATIKDALNAINNAYQDLRKKLSEKIDIAKESVTQKVSPIVAALIETTVTEEMPPMETPFEAPPLETVTTKAPSSIGSQPKSEGKINKPVTQGREDLLADIRKGRQLKPINLQPINKPVPKKLSQQQPSMMDELRQKLETRRQVITPEESEETNEEFI